MLCKLLQCSMVRAATDKRTSLRERVHLVRSQLLAIETNVITFIRSRGGTSHNCIETKLPWMYIKSLQGILSEPEFVKFVNSANYNQLRPEALESMFIMFRLTDSCHDLRDSCGTSRCPAPANTNVFCISTPVQTYTITSRS